MNLTIEKTEIIIETTEEMKKRELINVLAELIKKYADEKEEKENE
ncbi:hypothetical protein ABE288_07325 [Bacillus salipaludis]